MNYFAFSGLVNGVVSLFCCVVVFFQDSVTSHLMGPSVIPPIWTQAVGLMHSLPH